MEKLCHSWREENGGVAEKADELGRAALALAGEYNAQLDVKLQAAKENYRVLHGEAPADIDAMLTPTQKETFEKALTKLGQNFRCVLYRQMTSEQMRAAGAKLDYNRICEIVDSRSAQDNWNLCLIQDSGQVELPKNYMLVATCPSHRELNASKLPPLDAIVEMLTAAKKTGLQSDAWNSLFPDKCNEIAFWAKETAMGSRAIKVSASIKGEIFVYDVNSRCRDIKCCALDSISMRLKPWAGEV